MTPFIPLASHRLNAPQPWPTPKQALRLLLVVLLVVLLISTAAANAQTGAIPAEEITSVNGEVTVPLDAYQALIDQTRAQPAGAPTRYALGQSTVTVEFRSRQSAYDARVSVELKLAVFEAGWTAIRLLGPGAALENAWVGDQPLHLLNQSDGLYWITDQPGDYVVGLIYHVDTQRNTHGNNVAYLTTLPLPRAASTQLSAVVPLNNIDLSLTPIHDQQQTHNDGHTKITGTVPTTEAVMISWHGVSAQPYIISRAQYRGELRGEAIAWQVDYEVDLLENGPTQLPLLPLSVTLIDLRVDGEPATVLTGDERFAVSLSASGAHRVQAHFLTAVDYPDGIPASGFELPAVPVSEFSVTLPGDKLLSVTPRANIDRQHDEQHTTAHFYLPLHDQVAMHWSEAIPDDVTVETRANAGVYQALHAAEGVLYGHAEIVYEITRGETSTLSFSVPASAHVNRIDAASVSIADWIEVDRESPTERRLIQVFLNRPITDRLLLKVDYEQLLDAQQELISVPLARAEDVARQRGMLALLASRELALKPDTPILMSEVGENQLPADFRNPLQWPVLHTFKYHDPDSALSVSAQPPEREHGKFNVQIDTLVSISEVALKGAASIEVNVKSGSLQTLELSLPGDLNILGVSGPSLRNHNTINNDSQQTVAIEFTREMDGLFVIELNYERIMRESDAETRIPDIAVAGADVEHGRVAVEALSALEIQPVSSQQLSTLEVDQLPRQLLLKTTNPILLAYKYVKSGQSIDLRLQITRHREIDVQVAAIDQAEYETLFTEDGLAVTQARFDVRNSRRQFLRLGLPKDAEIWSVFVNGRAQKPARASDEHPQQQDVLIKMINSATPFPVEVVYATQAKAMKAFGELSARLPQPDMIVTQSGWNVYVPSGPDYRTPHSNMNLGDKGKLIHHDQRPAAALAQTLPGDALKLKLPAQGLLYRFTKLYANQTGEDAFFTLRYTRADSGRIALAASLMGVIVLWLGVGLLAFGQHRNGAIGLMVIGAAPNLIALGYFNVRPLAPSVLAVLIGLVFASVAIVRWRKLPTNPAAGG